MLNPQKTLAESPGPNKTGRSRNPESDSICRADKDSVYLEINCLELSELFTECMTGSAS